MKKTWLTLCVASLAGALLCSCGEKEEIVPEMQANTPAPAEKKVEQQAPAAEEPELVPIQSLSQDAQPEETAEPAKAESAPVVSGSIQQQSEGAFVIQVSIQPSKKGADAIIKKLAEQNIKAYVAEVENPGELEGTYYRVRVGFFPTYAVAQEYGKQVLSALNFQWWVDNSKNDEVGNPAGESDESSSYYAPPQDNQETASEPEPAPAPEPEPAPAPAPAPEPEPAPAPAPAPEPAPAPAPAPEPAPAPAPAQAAPSAPPAPPAEDFVDDWE